MEGEVPVWELLQKGLSELWVWAHARKVGDMRAEREERSLQDERTRVREQRWECVLRHYAGYTSLWGRGRKFVSLELRRLVG